jgi:hypothetical protein
MWQPLLFQMGLSSLHLSNLRPGCTRTGTTSMSWTCLRWRYSWTLQYRRRVWWKPHQRVLISMCSFLCFTFFAHCWYLKSRTTFIMPPTFLFFSKQTIFLIKMFLTPTSIFDPTIYPFANKPYPPAILVKHHTWFFSDANLFISLDGVLYGVHQFYFNQLPLFQEIIHYGKTNEISVISLHCQGFTKLHSS